MAEMGLIWDLDGTLIDSYPAIMEALDIVHKEWDLTFNKEEVATFVLKESVGQHLKNLSEAHSLPFEQLLGRFSEEQAKRDHMITLLPFAKEALQFAQDNGMINLMYTHKGATTNQVLADLGLLPYFTEVLNATSGFARKPDPEAIHYLVEKYELDKDKTYYIGDRRLDVETAENAGIQSLNLVIPNSDSNHKIADLSAIETYFKNKD